MEPIIIFLLKAVAGGTAGHYLKKALTKIDSELGSLFDKGASVKEIEEAIERKQVAGQVNEVFEESIKTSTILSDNLSVAATPDDIVQEIEAVVTLGFAIARQENFDLVLPGSPLSADSISVFETGTETSVDVEDRSITWNRFAAKLFILPMPSAEVTEYWGVYLKRLRELRADSRRRRLRIQDIATPDGLSVEFEIDRLTAGSLRFRAPKAGDTPTMAYIDWSNGLLAMFEGVKMIKDLNYLPMDQWEKLKTIAAKRVEVLGT
jgi:hypothetical protein